MAFYRKRKLELLGQKEKRVVTSTASGLSPETIGVSVGKLLNCILNLELGFIQIVQKLNQNVVVILDITICQ